VRARARAHTHTHTLRVQVWPTKGLHYATVAKLAALLGDARRTADAAQRALQCLVYTHGDGAVVREVSGIMQDAMRELRAAEEA
jgi:hypothetical protein